METIKTILKSKILLVSICSIVASLFLAGNADAAVVIYGYVDRQVNSGQQIILNGSAYDSSGLSLSFSWSCNGGNLSNYNSLNVTYTAPMVPNDTTFFCTLTATNTNGVRNSYTNNILVKGTSAYHYTVSDNLYVSLIPSSSYAVAPLNNVSLTASLSGDIVSGAYVYMFDCKNDNSWENRVQTTNTIYTAYNICSYPTAGTYTARVRVESANHSAENIATIIVAPAPVYIAPTPKTVIKTVVTQKVSDVVLETLSRNLTQNEILWRNLVDANSGDQLEFNIIITPTIKTLDNVVVKNVLSDSIDSVSDIKVGDKTYNGVIDFIDVGTVELGTSKVINFKAKVVSDASLNYGIAKITNTSEVSASNTTPAKKDLTINLSKGIQATASLSDFTSKTVGVYLAISIIVFLAMLVLIFYLLIERRRMAVEAMNYAEKTAGPEDLKINKSKYFVINS